MTNTYTKLPFVWPGSRPMPPGDDPPRTAWVPAASHPELVSLVGACLAASVDGWDVSAVHHLGPDGAAALILADIEGFSHRDGWWEILTVGGDAAGFVLPVIYDGCEQGGLDEATIFHVGVSPEFRGRGLGRTLLRRATATLLDHGVWRIYCDTAAENTPMIHLFTTEGWTREPAHDRPTFTP